MNVSVNTHEEGGISLCRGLTRAFPENIVHLSLLTKNLPPQPNFSPLEEIPEQMLYANQLS